ncbi:unnamed protein product, partial [Candidula unifasciata]
MPCTRGRGSFYFIHDQTSSYLICFSVCRLPIDECELVLVHTVPVGQDIRVTDRPLRQ